MLEWIPIGALAAAGLGFCSSGTTSIPDKVPLITNSFPAKPDLLA